MFGRNYRAVVLSYFWLLLVILPYLLAALMYFVALCHRQIVQIITIRLLSK